MNIVFFTANISRVYQIAKIGNHSICFAYNSELEGDRKVNPKDIDYVSAHYKEMFVNDHFKPTPTDEENADMIIEFIRPQYQDIRASYRRKSETLAELTEHVLEAKKKMKREDIDDTWNDASHSLMQTAYDRLNFSLTDVIKIQALAKSIAHLDGSKTVRTEHVAEAIQYRSIGKDEHTTIYKP